MSDPTAHGALSEQPSVDTDRPAVALGVGAHPDDIDFGAGGTLAKWASAGCEVHHLVCTDGSKGSWDPDEDKGLLIATRQEEQREASRRLGGGGRVTFLGEVDGELAESRDLVGRIALEIRRVRPEVVLGHDPWKRYRLHPDHRHAGFLLTDAVVAARDPHFFPEHGLAPHRPREILLWEADAPDHLEDITGFEDVKLHALLAHSSQLRSTMKIESEDDEDALAAFRERLQARHERAGLLVGVRAAEAFKRLTDL